MIDLDGSLGEGGGQILRSALSLSLLTGQPFKLRKIRANRLPKPGLRPQHLACVRAAATISQATVTGDAVGSGQLTFHPGEVKPGKYRFAIGTAGSTSLLLHTIYLPLALAKESSDITLEGGTHNDKAPCFHFLQTTWSAYVNRLGIDLKLTMELPGFYPKGGGLLRAFIARCPRIVPLRITDSIETSRANILSFTSGLPEHVAERQSRRAEVRLRDAGLKTFTTVEHLQGEPGCMLAITVPAPVPTLFVGLGARGKPAEVVADEAVDQVLAFQKAAQPVDPHSADQLLLPLSLAQGKSEFHVSEVTRHLTTNADVIRQFLDRDIRIEGEEGETGIVRVVGRKL